MPKIYKSEHDRKITAFRKWFRGKRAEAGITQADLARKRGITQSCLSKKLQVKGSDQIGITYEDLLDFFAAVKATPEEIVRYMKL